MVIDYLDYQGVGENASFRSFPENEPLSRVIFQYPTPFLVNSFTSIPEEVVINEWMSGNESFIADPLDGSHENWFELI